MVHGGMRPETTHADSAPARAPLLLKAGAEHPEADPSATWLGKQLKSLKSAVLRGWEGGAQPADAVDAVRTVLSPTQQSHFGHRAIGYDTVHSGTVTARTLSVLWAISVESLMELDIVHRGSGGNQRVKFLCHASVEDDGERCMTLSDVTCNL